MNGDYRKDAVNLDVRVSVPPPKVTTVKVKLIDRRAELIAAAKEAVETWDVSGDMEPAIEKLRQQLALEGKR